MRKNITQLLIILSIPLFISLFSTTGCKKETWKAFWSSALDSILNGKDVSTLFGWQQEEEKLNNMESDINLGDENNLPSKVDLSQYFPPIGNQGQYGTCVAWAVGYNLRSFLSAYDGKYSPTSQNLQFSPKDLFWAIPSSSKGDDCNGANFEPALDVLVERGITPMSEVPYNSLGDCSQKPLSSWDNVASKYKIEKYRKISDNDGNVDIGVVKSYLYKGQAVVIGARLGDRFMEWDNSVAINSDTYNNPGMQHAYHAMIVSGYDDNKQAFRVVNSWDTGWGDNGYIWVDYNFFQKSFVFAAFVGSINKQEAPDVIIPDAGYDLQAWDLIDKLDPEGDGQVDRLYEFNVYNVGNDVVKSSMNWNILYLYYDAYDANNYGIITYLAMTNKYGTEDHGTIPSSAPASERPGLDQNEWINVDLPSEQSLVDIFGEFSYYYTMPNLTGDYYLVEIVDGYDDIKETDEENNYFFITDYEGNPLKIQNGVVTSILNSKKKSSVKPKAGEKVKSPSQTAVNQKNLNTYRPEEIMKLVKSEKKSGRLYAKVNEFVKKNKNKKHNGIVKKN